MSGYHCLDCGHDFHEDEAATAESSELLDDMNDRPPSRFDFDLPACPECDSTDLQALAFCERCEEQPAKAGSDYCAPCFREVVREDTEAAHRECLEAASPLREWRFG